MNDDDKHRDVHLDHPPIEPHSCKHCQRIALGRENFTEPTNRLMLPHTISEIRHAIKEKCEFFMLFVSHSGPHHLMFCCGCSGCSGSQEWRMSRMDMLKRVLGFTKTREHSYNWTKQTYRFKLKSFWKRGRVSLTLKHHPSHWFTALELNYHGWFGPLEICSSSMLIGVQGRAVSEVGTQIVASYSADVASEHTLRQVYRWIAECQSCHPLCRQDHSSFIPRRLLHIDLGTKTAIVRLVETREDLQCRWAALSYVWGGDQKLKTTLSSIADMKAGIKLERLPQTLQDAVTVCRALRLELLWVDALCIIQDDQEDLDRELASMPQIYQKAWVTISASAAATVSDGFLQQRCYSHEKTPIALPYLADEGLDTCGIICLPDAGSLCTSYLDNNEPINQRAWTYQERRLSQRVLDFNHSQVVLYCYTNKRCQGSGSLEDWSENSEESRLYKPVSDHQALPEWRDIVDVYVTRKVSFASDRLKAISALADIYRQRTGYTYLAGLWEESLVYDLCWKTGENEVLPRPREYRAPSWSWAAVDVVASYRNGSRKPQRIYSDEPYHTTIAQANVTDVSVRQEPPNTTFGRIYAGCLTLEAPMLWTKWDYLVTNLELGQKSAFVTRDAKGDCWIEEDGQINTSVLAVLLTRTASTKVKGVTIYCGLVLVPASEGMYRRVGLFEFFDPNVDVDDDEGFRSLFDIHIIIII